MYKYTDITVIWVIKIIDIRINPIIDLTILWNKIHLIYTKMLIV